ncbi:fibronectin type III domain-containing protein [Cohnella rhizosphaerae]|uniref:Fibronectin type III domain-containing protein n=1 Tax=Cohnella rhizosphaerae TaxID=1457232 RepID=A0A9X4KTB2_9BACL|nr:fibronectin type III domain-containing protein [Cohnella rhizosphaerae]MDG0809851.1 fibronectin type III domain-containing protein [Cohnella rhizosphaerae]
MSNGWKSKSLSALLALTLMIPLFGAGADKANADVPAGWQPIDTEPSIAAGSALDLSGLNDVPAGSHGFIQIDGDGDYVFSGQTQRKVKLYGANLSWKMYYGSREDAERTAERLARLGYNVVRLHSLDSMGDDAPGVFKLNSATPQINEDRMDQVEYLISRLKAHGIYVTIDLFQLYDFKNDPSLNIYGSSYNSPYLFPFVPAAVDSWKTIASALLTHVNPYTGLALKNDPVLVGVSPWNESLVLNMNLNSMTSTFRQYLLDDFNEFLDDRGAAPVASMPNSYWSASGTLKDQLSAYYSARTIAAANEMRNYLKNVLQVHAPVGGLNFIYSPNVNFWRDQSSDVYETHMYHQFVTDSAPVNNGQYGFQYNALKYPRLSMTFDAATNASYPPAYAGDTLTGSYYPSLALRQKYDTPFILTEFQDTFPVKGREEVGIFNGAIGAYQGWDMMNRYSFGMNVGDAYANNKLGTPETFSITNDPLAITSETQAALLYRTGAVQASAPKFAIVWDKAWVSDKGEASDLETRIANMMYIPHLFNTATVYADNPGQPFAVYKITPDLTSDDIKAGDFPAANLVPITTAMNKLQVAETMINALDASPMKTAMLDALDDNKLLSDTGELLFDLNLNTYMVRAPKVVAAAGTMNNNALDLGSVSVTGNVYKGTFLASSLDNNALEDSDRMLLIYTTDVAATGERTIQQPGGIVQYYKGTLPTLAKEQTAVVKLATDRPAAGYKAYKLALNGVRLQEIPVAVDANGISLQLDTDKGFSFELVYDPMFEDTFEDGNANGWTAATGQWSVVTSGGNAVYRASAKGKSLIDATYGGDYAIEADVNSTNGKGGVGLLAKYADQDNFYVFKYHARTGKAVIKKRVGGVASVVQAVYGLPTAAAGTPYKLRFETIGDSLVGSLNGVPVITAADASLAGGKAGLVSGSKQPVAFDNIVVRHYDRAAPAAPAGLTAAPISANEIDLSWQAPADETGVKGYKVFRDGVEVATVNGAFQSYKDTGLTISTTYHYKVKAYDLGDRLSNASGDMAATTTSDLFATGFEDLNLAPWTVVGGWGTFYIVKDGNTRVYLSDNASSGSTKSVTGPKSTDANAWTNYSVEAKIKVDSWHDRAGLVARFIDFNNYYYMSYSGYYHTVSLVKYQNGADTTLATASLSADPAAGAYHTFRMEVNSSSIKGYIDGALLVSGTSIAFTSGQAGVYSHMQKTYFDDFNVQKL